MARDAFLVTLNTVIRQKERQECEEPSHPSEAIISQLDEEPPQPTQDSEASS